MRTFWSDPYLWIHAAGVAAVPLGLVVCLLGLAVGDPLLPVWLELGLIAIVGIAPIVWMQWQKPFYIFSLVAVAVKPERLTDDQRRILTLFKSRRSPVWIGLGALVMWVLLWQIYLIAPIAADVTPFPVRGLGLGVAAIAFLASNLFLQVPLSVGRVLLASDQEFAVAQPFAVEQILPAFSVLGLKVNQIVLPLLPDEIAAAPTASIGADPLNSVTDFSTPDADDSADIL
ncbi:low-complexity tail membrane protein [Phormidesmis priestleyi ULC007]|uniref:Low-complexity tail membrane protein n=1 Tax=Phormidesmis priestleyi ULC007 TaxID=1920490 RepID=A0A2T1DCT6_9CYAN|nr:low-complexity tail membrane protein [Phormidesmis priestleyi]PSB18251.1 low-complexity tail membrane protein [Phormidesmis priestleyi ULC007]PZO49522.1 MAG: low-complexity tail membrane protein [Phormidesmis priestleyi]